MNIKKITPVLTEKSLKLASDGVYTFLLPIGVNKYKAREMIENSFDVKVVSIRSVNTPTKTKKNFRGRKRNVTANKKVYVKLAEKQKIDLFDVERK